MKKGLTKSYYVPAVMLLIMAFITGIDYFFKCVNGSNLNVLDSNGIINVLYFFFHWIFVVPGFVASSIMLITKRKGFFLSLPFLYLTIISFLLIVFDLGAGLICTFTNQRASVPAMLTSVFSEFLGNVLLFVAFACTTLNIYSNWLNKKSRIWFVPGAFAIAWGVAWSISLFITNDLGSYPGDMSLFELLEYTFSLNGLDTILHVTPHLPKVSIGLLVFSLFIINSKLSKDIDKGYIEVE